MSAFERIEDGWRIFMSLDKAIEHGKEKRKPYYGCRAIDPS